MQSSGAVAGKMKSFYRLTDLNKKSSTTLFGNVQEVETVGVESIANDNVEEDSAPADSKGKEVATMLDATSEAGVSECNASTPESTLARKLEDHNVGGSEGRAVLYHIDETQHTASGSDVLEGLNWCISILATLFFSVMRIPYQFLVQIVSILSNVVSLYSGFRSDPHEPLQRRISQLETEVDKLKPLQEIFPKHTGPAVDPAEKLSLLETELANTKKTLRSVLTKQEELYAVLKRMKEFKCLQVQEKCW